VDEADFIAGREVTLDADPLVADIDAAKVERILENLLVNAVKHTAPGTPVWIRVAGNQDTVSIAVEDAGPGVPVEVRESIFQPFHRGYGEQVAPGSGIGLSLVARFAELHGGRAWVEEREGGGASFRVDLANANTRVASET
jgi:signal transduction histidine kinase